MEEEEKHEIKRDFYRKTGFPGVIGCIDGTHIKILPPAIDERFKYTNRKGFCSLNAMVVSLFNETLTFYSDLLFNSTGM